MEAELGTRIKTLREALGLRASDLATRVDLDPTALSKIENGRRAVKSVELARIAHALRVSPLALLQPDSLIGRLPVAARQAGSTIAMGAAYERLESLSELHVVLADNGFPSSPHLPSVPSVDGMYWLDAAETLSAWARENLQALPDGDDRFAALVETIETTLGLDVVVEAFDGDPLTGAAITDQSFPLLFVNAAHPLPRSLFTLAHELGHVLAGHNGSTITLDRELSGSTDDERMANAFAADFLMPEAIVRQTIEQQGRQYPTLVQLAYRLGVSFESLIYRLHNLGVIDARGRDKLKRVNWRGIVLAISEPSGFGGLKKNEAARFQARWVTPPPTNPPAMLIQRATNGYRKGAIGAPALADLLGRDTQPLLTQQLLAQLQDDPDLVAAREIIDADYAPAADADAEDPEERFSGIPF
ncbi:helix-turn-helix domain-containing protein [Kribbella sp. NPDC056951]|uniref:helix-turn-helix domain-containing protein n=1 Tax=Kribbella sp. NPDC056951 TaxID=3345978 RepID=UPI003624DF97